MMNDRRPEPVLDAPGREQPRPDRPDVGKPERFKDKGGSKRGRRLLGLAALLVLGVALARGVWWHYEQYRQAVTTAEQRANFVPNVRVGTVTMSGNMLNVMLPCTTLAFQAANIYARASGYILKRYVDIGSRVKQGDLLVEITAPELEDQVRQAEANRSQSEALLQQTEANRELAYVTNRRTVVLVGQGWQTKQQGDVDRLTLAAQQHAAQANEFNTMSQLHQLQVSRQYKAYQQVFAPFDGVVTQRNVDVGSLVQADATSGTFLFTMMHSDVMRIQAYVPQDQAFGLSPGDEAVIHVPELPNRSFPGKVTRIADALQPGTRTLLTEVDVPNPDGVLTPGTYCTIELRVPRRTPSFIVPADAVIFNQYGLRVAAVQNDTVHMQKIAIARDFGREVEVLTGVENGEKVILNPRADLEDGAKVHVQAAPAAANP
jgi:RND family efflux transporter MFP subunit